MENKKKKKEPENSKLFKFILISLFVTIFLNWALQSKDIAKIKTIPYSEFLDKVKNNEIESVEFRGETLYLTGKNYDDLKQEENLEISKKEPFGLNPFSLNKKTLDDGIINSSENLKSTGTGYIVINIPYKDLINVLEEYNISYWAPKINPYAKIFTNWILPFALFYGMIILLTTVMSKKLNGGMMKAGKTNAKIYKETKTGVKFEDVAGQVEAKESLREIVDYLHAPEKYIAIGAKQPKGALLVGPPGTGKTLLAKAVAGEGGVTFLSLVGSDFIEMYVGVGASRVRNLFKTAKENAPCIIFIDELDAIGKKRDTQFGGNDEREQTLNQLLAEMDGFESDKAVVILAATNRPEVLDAALLRPGRFDREIIVEKPDLKDRIAILKVHSKNVKIVDNLDYKKVALSTAGASGADLSNIVNEAALHAVRSRRIEVQQDDFMEAVETIVAGKEKKDRIMSNEEKKMVSYHEVGHALVAALQKNTDPIQKITIVPRTKGSLGYTMQVPEEEKFLKTKSSLKKELSVLLGGRAAEDLVFNESTTGAHNDIERCTQIARSMITEYGMSTKFGLVQLESRAGKYLGNARQLNCADKTGSEIDNEVRNIIDTAYKSSYSLLKQNKDVLNEISEFLLEKENISGSEFMKIFRKYHSE